LTGKVARPASAVFVGDKAVLADTRSDVADAGPPGSERMAVATAARAATVLLIFKIGFPFGLVLMALSAESFRPPVTRPWLSVAGSRATSFYRGVSLKTDTVTVLVTRSGQLEPGLVAAGNSHHPFSQWHPLGVLLRGSPPWTAVAAIPV
jgi:hypothetical protein